MALIMVVNEEEDACRLFRRILTAGKHAVQAYTDVDEAYVWLAKGTPEAVILEIDCESAGARRLLELMRVRRVLDRVIFIVGSKQSEGCEGLRGVAAQNILSKPFEIDELEKRVRIILGGGTTGPLPT